MAIGRAFLVFLLLPACGRPNEIVPAPPPVVWTRPEATLTVHDEAFQEWPPHSELHVAAEDVNLRAAPKTESPVVRELPIGTVVRLLAPVGEPVTVGERENLWYRVSFRDGESMIGGFVFGSTLTPIAMSTSAGLLVATFSPDKQPRLRLRHGEGTAARDIGEPGEGGTLRVIPLSDHAEVELCGGHGCTTWMVRLDPALSEIEP